MERAATLGARPASLGFIAERVKAPALVLLLAILVVLGLRAHMSYRSNELVVAGAQANEEGRARLAETLLSEALALNPGDAEARYQMATAQLMLGNLEGSLSSYRTARDLGRGDGGSLLNDVALRRLNAARTAEASALLLEALAENPFNSDYHLSLAVVFRREGKLLSERLEIERAAQAEPFRLRPLLRLADLEIRMNRPRQALVAARKALNLYPASEAAENSFTRATQALTTYRTAGARRAEW